MKAILSLVIILSSVNVFASAEMRSNAYWKWEMQKAREAFCKANAEYCEVEAQLKVLGEQRKQIASNLVAARRADAQICNSTAVRYSQRMSLDGQGVKFINYTPCEEIYEYTQNKNVPVLKAKQSQLSNQLRAKDAEIAAKKAQLQGMISQIKRSGS